MRSFACLHKLFTDPTAEKPFQYPPAGLSNAAIFDRENVQKALYDPKITLHRPPHMKWRNGYFC